MRKLTPIINLYVTANFLFEENKDGKVITTGTHEIFKLIPAESIKSITKAVKGTLIQDKHQMQLFLPFVFENNTIDNSVLDKYPENLLFYILVTDGEKFAYSGLPQKAEPYNILFVTPKNTTTHYQSENRMVSARPCSKGHIIAAADYILYIPADITRDRIQTLTGSNIQNTVDLKFVIGNKTVIVPRQNDLRKLHAQLKAFANKEVSFSIRNNSGDSLIKEFSRVLITEPGIPNHSIGLISIPKSILKTDELNYADYTNLNHFILHFPSFKTRLEITLSTNSFTDSDELLIDNNSLSFTVTDHPHLVKYKKIDCSVDNYFLYLYKQKNITMKKGNKKYELPFNPVLSYDASKSISKIDIIKNIH